MNVENNDNVDKSAEPKSAQQQTKPAQLRDSGVQDNGALSSATSMDGTLEEIRQQIYGYAQQYEGDTASLLALLRMLEALHVDIRDSLFQPSLPTNRQRLYALLRDIEMEGGWPYIPRMKLQRLLQFFHAEEQTRKEP